MELKHLISEKRHRLGLTQGQLAKRVGVHVSTLQKWESGGGVNIVNLQALAKALQVKVEDLLK